MRRRRLSLILALALAGLLVLAPAALANFITPKAGGSPNANEIDSLYKVILYIAIVVFAIVEGTLLYSLFKFRAKRGAVAAQIHGNTRLEIGWTVAATVILVVLTVVTFVKLPSIVNAPASSANGLLVAATTEAKVPHGSHLDICITGRQFIWRYTYGTNCSGDPFSQHLPYSYEQMYVPANTTVLLAIQSTDVIHSWWIPALGGKVDAVPGYTTYTWFKASKVGATYHGQCAQLCGREHYAMGADVTVLTPTAYQTWIAQQSANITAANDQVTQLRQQLTATGNL